MKRRYSVIYADPPWAYNDKAAAGKRGAVFKYPTLTDKEIARLPVPEIAADDSVCFLWVTWPKLPIGIAVLRRWGFTYKTAAFVWVKTTKSEPVRPRMMMGNWTRANSEVCLLGVRGKIKRADAGISQIVPAPPHEHSAKPPAVRLLIEKLMGPEIAPGVRIELFARGRIRGWDTWGLEATSSVNLGPNWTRVLAAGRRRKRGAK